MPAQPVLLIPPSESKRPGGDGTAAPGTFDSALRTGRRAVRAGLRDALARDDTTELARTFNARGPLLERMASTNAAYVRGRGGVMPAWRRYTGVVWVHLDPATLTSEQLRRVVVPSATYGITSAEDEILDFRLKMSAVLGELGNVARFWRPWLASVLARRFGNDVLVDLLPSEHAAAIDFDRLGEDRQLIHVHFVDEAGSRSVGHDAKAVKGVLARSLLQMGTSVLDDFEWHGWRTSRDGDIVRVIAPGSSSR